MILPTNSIAKNVAGFWGTHFFSSPGQAVDALSSGIWDRTIVRHDEIEAEQVVSTEAQNPIDQKGGDNPREFGINLQVNALASGQSPVSVYKSWVRDLGKSNLFFVGLLPFHSSRYILQRVEMSFNNADIHATGAPYRADIVLTFSEDTILEIPNKDVEETEDNGSQKSAAKVGPTKGEKNRVWKTENDRITDDDIERAKKAYDNK